MLIRFFVKNLFSFKELTEFNMLPGRGTRMPHHLYEVAGINILKLNAMYGANGAGKSNLIKALDILKEFVVTGKMPVELLTQTFKFDKESRGKDIYLGVEFIHSGTPYYYGITINGGIVVEEELQISGLQKKEDKKLFLRTDYEISGKIPIEFDEAILKDPTAELLRDFLGTEIVSRNSLVLTTFKNRNSLVFKPIVNALNWFIYYLNIISPNTKPRAQAIRFERNTEFANFAHEAIRAFNTGIKEVIVETIPVEEYYGKDNADEAAKASSDLLANPGRIQFFPGIDEEVVMVLEEGKAVAKRLLFTHVEDGGIATFNSNEESDGTRRLLDYLPPLFSAIHEAKVYIIDEIERSIHPLLIKEMISKFSADEQTQGQMIFSTHESTLLDQDIFRQDEIWFAEKKSDGATELYPLSEFKEHATIDIRKGYLNGRYGAIPFLANLKDLNWEHYAEAESI